ncbi:phage head morphogenesis protein [Xenorhabdus sp. PB61.4]|uniref:phage head morphogenesis protein n=2 Tax=Xenorhabdus sp. PB61.4 TaxID=2788940 RepID=UPI001E5EBE94|nr:phage minor head protein [Xenorhabdus sp. PB61.4]MCC8367088.1 phage head morphogenesis protein [Xenorhabdus sp. PB61.4]
MGKKKTKTGRSTRPNAGLEQEYYRRMQALIQEMANSVDYWLSAEYKRQQPEIVGDASPAKALTEKLFAIKGRWNTKFGQMAKSIAVWFVNRANTYASNSVKNKLKADSITVNMRVTPAVQNVLDSLYEQQVSLITSIPEQYLTLVQTLVQQSVVNGRDIGFLKAELKQRYRLTENRAKTIARDQNAKATNAIARERCKSTGITEGIWIHRAGGSKSYRESHIGMNGQRFTLSEGCYDPHVQRHIQPGELINCKCDFRPVIPQFGNT